jgi:hypothetical protein
LQLNHSLLIHLDHSSEGTVEAGDQLYDRCEDKGQKGDGERISRLGLLLMAASHINDHPAYV